MRSAVVPMIGRVRGDGISVVAVAPRIDASASQPGTARFHIAVQPPPTGMIASSHGTVKHRRLKQYILQASLWCQGRAEHGNDISTWQLRLFLLTPWIRVLLEKLTGSQLVNKLHEVPLPHSQATTTSPYSEPDQSSPCPHLTYWRSILILSSHLSAYIPIGIFLSGIPTKSLYTPVFPHTFYIPAHLILLLLFTQANNFIYVRLEAQRTAVLWKVMPCNLVESKPTFRRNPMYPSSPHNQHPPAASFKRCWISTKIHGVILHKTATFHFYLRFI